MKIFILLIFFAWNASLVNVQFDTAVYSGNLILLGQVYLSPARFVPSSQIVPSSQVTGNFIVVKPAQR